MLHHFLLLMCNHRHTYHKHYIYTIVTFCTAKHKRNDGGKMTSFPIKPDYIIDLNIKEQLHMNYAKKRRIGRKRMREKEKMATITQWKRTKSENENKSEQFSSNTRKKLE